MVCAGSFFFSVSGIGYTLVIGLSLVQCMRSWAQCILGSAYSLGASREVGKVKAGQILINLQAREWRSWSCFGGTTISSFIISKSPSLMFDDYQLNQTLVKITTINFTTSNHVHMTHIRLFDQYLLHQTLNGS